MARDAIRFHGVRLNLDHQDCHPRALLQKREVYGLGMYTNDMYILFFSAYSHRYNSGNHNIELALVTIVSRKNNVHASITFILNGVERAKCC